MAINNVFQNVVCLFSQIGGRLSSIRATGSGEVLFVGDGLEPVDDLVVGSLFGDGDVGVTDMSGEAPCQCFHWGRSIRRRRPQGVRWDRPNAGRGLSRRVM